MQPTIYEGDKILSDAQFYAKHQLRDDDIVVFRKNGNLLCKRVSALPGEIIEERQGILIRNGQVVSEPYRAAASGGVAMADETFPPRRMPSDQIFVTGDNRDASFDSRYDSFGPVYLRDVAGKVVYLYGSMHTSPHPLN